MRTLLFVGFVAIACGGRVESVPAAGTGASTGGVRALGGATGTGGAAVTGGSSGTAAVRCAGSPVELEPDRVALELVVDVSSTMNDPPPNSTSAGTKWEITRSGLIEALDHLPAWAELGVTFFPNKTTQPNTTGEPNSDCLDPSDNIPLTALGNPGSPARTDIVNRLNAITIPIYAGTPTDDAYLTMLTALRDASSAPDYVLLITDGQPNFSLGCMGYGVEERPVDPAPLIQHIADAYTNAQIETLVIGLPGSETSYGVDAGTDARSWLSAAATAGGTADLQPGCSNTGSPTYCHSDLTTAGDFGPALGGALQVVVGRIAPCVYRIVPPDGTAFDPLSLNVVYTDEVSNQYLVPHDQTADCQIGWRYTDSTATKLELCGQTCQVISGVPFGQISISFECAHIVLPPI
jgi:hypothetical protein